MKRKESIREKDEMSECALGYAASHPTNADNTGLDLEVN